MLASLLAFGSATYVNTINKAGFYSYSLYNGYSVNITVPTNHYVYVMTSSDMCSKLTFYLYNGIYSNIINPTSSYLIHAIRLDANVVNILCSSYINVQVWVIPSYLCPKNNYFVSSSNYMDMRVTPTYTEYQGCVFQASSNFDYGNSFSTSIAQVSYANTYMYTNSSLSYPYETCNSYSSCTAYPSKPFFVVYNYSTGLSSINYYSSSNLNYDYTYSSCNFEAFSKADVNSVSYRGDGIYYNSYTYSCTGSSSSSTDIWNSLIGLWVTLIVICCLVCVLLPILWCCGCGALSACVGSCCGSCCANCCCKRTPTVNVEYHVNDVRPSAPQFPQYNQPLVPQPAPYYGQGTFTAPGVQLQVNTPVGQPPVYAPAYGQV